MSLNSPTINKAIGKLVKKHIFDKYGVVYADEGLMVESYVVTVLDLLGYLGVLKYSDFNPDRVEEGLSLGGLVLELEDLDKRSN